MITIVRPPCSTTMGDAQLLDTGRGTSQATSPVRTVQGDQLGLVILRRSPDPTERSTDPCRSPTSWHGRTDSWESRGSCATVACPESRRQPHFPMRKWHRPGGRRWPSWERHSPVVFHHFKLFRTRQIRRHVQLPQQLSSVRIKTEHGLLFGRGTGDKHAILPDDRRVVTGQRDGHLPQYPFTIRHVPLCRNIGQTGDTPDPVGPRNRGH